MQIFQDFLFPGLMIIPLNCSNCQMSLISDVYFKDLTFWLVDVMEFQLFYIIKYKGRSKIFISQSNVDVLHCDAIDMTDIECPRGEFTIHGKFRILFYCLVDILNTIQPHVSHCLGSTTWISDVNILKGNILYIMPW